MVGYRQSDVLHGGPFRPGRPARHGGTAAAAYEDAFLLVLEATPASGLVLLASRETQLKQAAFDAARLVEDLRETLPQQLSSKVGAPLLTGATV